MIKIIGDVHSKTGDYKRLVRSMEPGQRSIQVGIWRPDMAEAIIERAKEKA